MCLGILVNRKRWWTGVNFLTGDRDVGANGNDGVDRDEAANGYVGVSGDDGVGGDDEVGEFADIR